jgi:hypothetical protein
MNILGITLIILLINKVINYLCEVIEEKSKSKRCKMYINEKNDYKHHYKFLTQIEKIICRFTEQGDGRVDINIERHPFRKGHSEYMICASNLSSCISSISSRILREHLSNIHKSSTNKQAFEVFKEGLLNVVKEDGFGRIRLMFKKNRQGKTIIFCEITISQKYVI